MSEKIKVPYAVWTVGDEEHKLKLKTSSIKDLEVKYKQNLLNLMGSPTGAGMPPLATMLDLTHVAMKEFHSGLKPKEVDDIFDKYIDEGGSQLDFYMNVYMKIFTVSGFFSETLAESMDKTLEEAKQTL